MGYQMVTWAMMSRDPKGAVRQQAYVRSSILTTYLASCLDIFYGIQLPTESIQAALLYRNHTTTLLKIVYAFRLLRQAYFPSQQFLSVWALSISLQLVGCDVVQAYIGLWVDEMNCRRVCSITSAICLHEQHCTVYGRTIANASCHILKWAFVIMGVRPMRRSGHVYPPCRNANLFYASPHTRESWF